MSATSSLLTFSTISSPVTQTGVVQVTSQSSLNQSASSSSYVPYNPYPSPDPNQNANPDPFNSYQNGPSVYLYGFLATLVLIFAVSIGVAWRGYYARRLLRARIEEALARGVVLPGYAGEYPLLGGGLRVNTPLGPRPVIYDAWMDVKQDQEKMSLPSNAWDIQPASLDLLRPFSPTQEQNHTFSPLENASSLLRQLVNPIREFWFVPPPDGTHPGQLQGRSAQSITPGTLNAREGDGEGGGRNDVKWEGAEGVALSVLITMPDPERHSTRDGLGKGKGPANSRPTSLSVSEPPSNLEAREEEAKYLPAMVLGYTEAPLPVISETGVDSTRASGIGARTKSQS